MAIFRETHNYFSGLTRLRDGILPSAAHLTETYPVSGCPFAPTPSTNKNTGSETIPSSSAGAAGESSPKRLIKQKGGGEMVLRFFEPGWARFCCQATGAKHIDDHPFYSQCTPGLTISILWEFSAWGGPYRGPSRGPLFCGPGDFSPFRS